MGQILHNYRDHFSLRKDAWHRDLVITILVSLAIVIACFVMRQQSLWALSILGSTIGQPFVNSEYGPVLFFQNDSTFQITVFNDLHFGEAPELGWGPLSDAKSIRVMNSVLDNEHQELVILNGDLITGENTYFHNSTKYLDMIVAPLVKRRLPFASTYGNHDSQFNLSTFRLLQAEKRYSKHSLTQSMISGEGFGVSNYFLPVYPNQYCRTPAVILWFFDSRGGSKYQMAAPNGTGIGIPGFVHPSVADWFRFTRKSLTRRYRRTIPSLAFVHIPIYAAASFQATGVDENKNPGINDDDPLAPQGIKDGVYVGSDIPFMRALLETEGLMAVFSGHDHGDDWCQKWNRRYPDMSLTGNGMFICFGRHSGYGGYGQWTRGSRQILLQRETLGKELKTWIRIEDGTISGSVVLNSTYGHDDYPKVDRTYT